MPRILLVDADHGEPSPLASALHDVAEVLPASSREPEFARLLHEQPFDLALIDLTRANGGGVEVCRQVHQSPQGARVPILLLIEPGDAMQALRGIAAGADGYIAKDRPLDEMVRRVQETLNRGTWGDAKEPLAFEFCGEKFETEAGCGQLLDLALTALSDVVRLNRRYGAELSQRRRVEKALMDSEALYHSLVERLPLALFRKDRQGRFSFVNSQVAEAIGRPPDDILGKTDYDFFPEELADKYRADDQWVIQTERVFETIEEFRLPDGELRYAHVMKTPVYDSNGDVIGVQGIFSDVTDRRRAELALDYERQLLQTLMNYLPDSIYFKDRESRFIRLSREVSNRFGLSDPQEAVGKTDADFFTEKHSQQARDDELEVMRTGRPIVGKEEMETWPDGHVTWVSTTKLPWLAPTGQVIGTFGISRDVTEQKRAAEMLRQAKEAAEAANRAKSDFLANMSHEIRTPLNAILGMTELVLDTELSHVQRDYLTMVRDSGESLLSVINDILDFSKIEAGRLDLEYIPFHLHESLGDTMKSLALRAHRKGLELAYHIAPQVPHGLAGDPVRLRQVVVNLVGNAIKFTEQGEVVVDVETEAETDQEIVLHFQVRDTGIGIPDDKLERIFDAFEQADTSMTRRYGGTGLGLAISSRLIDLMGGRVWVESEVGRGSTFHFTAHFGKVASLNLAEPASAAQLVGMRVLIVDDNETNRRILEEILSNWDMRPTTAVGVEDALRRLRKSHAEGTPFELVLTDASMPDLDGFTLAERIKADPELNEAVIMMLASGDRPGDVARCQQLGIAGYLIKPVKQSELFDAIAHAVSANQTEVYREPTPTIPAPTRPLRILLAEDSYANQRLALGLLGRWGHSVRVATNGVEALAAWREEPFDVILMDVQMPEMDGLEATRRLRAEEADTGRHTQIVAMTAHAMKGDRELCLDAGMDDYLMKPIRPRQLAEALEGVTERTPPVDLASGSSSVINWSDARAAVNGDSELLHEIVEASLEECPRLLAELEEALRRGDAKTVQRAAHTIKGTLRIFSAEPAQQLALRLEELGRDGQLDVAAAELPALEIALESVLLEWKAYLQTETANF